MRPAFISNVESNTPSWAITRAGWPIRVTFNFSHFSLGGKASSRSKMLSTDKFDAPHTRTRSGFGVTSDTVVSWRIISMRVCVLPVPDYSMYQTLNKGTVKQSHQPGGP